MILNLSKFLALQISREEKEEKELINENIKKVKYCYKCKCKIEKEKSCVLCKSSFYCSDTCKRNDMFLHNKLCKFSVFT